MVAAVAHTYERTATEIGDGRLASVFGSHLGGPRKGDDRSLSTAAYVRVLDLKSVATAFLLRFMDRISGFSRRGYLRTKQS
jgi:hypothetical protein